MREFGCGVVGLGGGGQAGVHGRHLNPIELEPPEPQTIDIPVIEAQTLAIEAAPVESPPGPLVEPLIEPLVEPLTETLTEPPEKRSSLVILKPATLKKGSKSDRPSPPHHP